MLKNYYGILEVESDATQEQIKSQYHLLLHAWHPDKFPNPDQKAKAEERTKEINEAYRILGNRIERAKYDYDLLEQATIQSTQAKPSEKPIDQHPNAPYQEKYSHSAQHEHVEEPVNSSVTYCQNCGLVADTKYVEFYENIGALVFRYHRSIKGNLCKSCINLYFWNFTGKTMLLGWWGLISFIVTPFILLNNMLRFIFTLGLTGPSDQPEKTPSPFWILSTVGGCIVIFMYISSLFPSQKPTSYTGVESIMPSEVSPTLIPTSTAIKIPTPTEPVYTCTQWSQVTTSMAGHQTCVYGVVYSIYPTNESATRIVFTSQPNSFFLYDANHIYPELKKGDCVVADETLLIYNKKIPYMNVSGLYKCEDWMK